MGDRLHSKALEEMIELLARGPTADEIANFHLSPAAISQVRAMLRKNKAGTLTAEEERELDRLILLDDMLGLIESQVM